MPFTSKYVIEHYLKLGCKTDKVYGGIADGKKVVFIEIFIWIQHIAVCIIKK